MGVVCFKILEDYCQPWKAVIASPQKFIKMGEEKEGRGDTCEALIARLHIRKHKNRLNTYKSLYGSDLIIQEKDDNYVELRRTSSIYSGVYCVYSELIDLVNTKPQHRVIFPKANWLMPDNQFEFSIDPKIFGDFGSDEKGNIKIRIFYFESLGEIKNRLCEAVSVKSNAAKCHEIMYTVKDTGYWECPEYMHDTFLNFPYELFYKRGKFKYQKEYRVVFPNHIFNFSPSYLSTLIHLKQPLDTLYMGDLPISGNVPFFRVSLPYCKVTTSLKTLYHSTHVQE